MKCDHCRKIIEIGETYVTAMGTFGQPLIWCSETCRDLWGDDEGSYPDGDPDNIMENYQ